MLATILGTVMGLARLSSNWLVAKLAQIYVEAFRNIPLPLQLLFWWGLLRGSAPSPREAWQPLPGLFVSNRGILFPVPLGDPAYWWMAAAFALALVIAYGVHRWARRRQMETGRQFPAGWLGFGLAVGLPLAVFVAQGMPLEMEWPVLRGFNFSGGTVVSPEFGALLIGLVIYTGSFIAEIVRAGILAVSWGQSEAAMALGLQPGQRMRLIVLPQALRGHRAADDQRILEPDQEQLARGDHRLSRSGLDRQYDDEPDRPGVGDRDDHGGLSGDQPVDLAVDEPLQPLGRAGGAIAVMDLRDSAIQPYRQPEPRARTWSGTRLWSAEWEGRRGWPGQARPRDIFGARSRWWSDSAVADIDIAQQIPLAAQRPPVVASGVIGWLRANLFNSVFNTILTIVAVYFLVVTVPPMIRWALIDAIWSAPNGQACRGAGACWAFIHEKLRFILFGRFPYDEQWRPLLVIVLFIGLILASCDRRMWGRRLAAVAGRPGADRHSDVGGVFGLLYVPTELWSGLPRPWSWP